MLLISVLVAVVLVLGIGFLAPELPTFGGVMNGTYYQIVAIVLAIVISMVLNMPMLNMLRANAMYAKGKYKDALKLYKKAYGSKRLSADMEIYCGYIFLKEGDKEACREALEKIGKKKLSPRQKNSLDTNMAILLWKEGKIDESISLLENVWEREPSVTVAGTLGAIMLIKARDTGDVEKALSFCEETNKTYTYEKTILANMGEAYYVSGQNERSLEVFGELMDCGSTAPAAYYHYGLALKKAGRLEEAEEMLRKALRLRFSNLSTVSKKSVKAALEEITAE